VSSVTPSQPYLRIGSGGPLVRSIQDQLRKEGFLRDGLDGVFDRETAEAVRRYQDSRKLDADGIVGPDTWRALAEGGLDLASLSPRRRGSQTRAPRPFFRIGSWGPHVGAVQAHLGVTPTTVFDVETEEAVRAFQERQGLPDDGIVGRQTWAMLLRDGLDDLLLPPFGDDRVLAVSDAVRAAHARRRGEELTSYDLVAVLLKGHPEYADGRAGSFDVGAAPPDAERLFFMEWLARVWPLFNSRLLDKLTTRTVVWGLALLDSDLRERLDEDDFLTAFRDHRTEAILSPEGLALHQGRSEAHRPEARISRDFWTAEDFLGYDFYADAIKEFILHRDTQPPLVIGIKAPWGAGKTSLMRMVRRGLDPEAEGDPPPESKHRVRLTNRELIDLTRRKPADAALELFPPQSIVDGASRTTVWFNAWKYQSSEQTWSGLAHAIITEVESRMTPIQRERFWASLNLARVNPIEVRRRIYRVLLERVLPFALALLVVGIVALGAYLLAPVFPGASSWLKGTSASAIVLAALGTSGAAVRRYRSFLREEVARSDPTLVNDPGYEGRLGFLHLVQTDMARVLDLVASEKRPLVVFVDDLDRCSYSTVAQTIEALNLFLAGDFRSCIFVIAMEPDLVAAHIEVAYKEVFAALADDDLGGDPTTLGWRFLEKMVQLPLSLPVPHADQLTAYVESILAKQQERPKVDRERVDEYRAKIQKRRPSIDAMERSSLRELRRLADGSSDPRDPALIRALEEEFSEALTDSDPGVQAIIRRHASDLSRNPREIKRFINVFRFYALIQYRRKVRGLPAPTYQQVGKLAVLAVRWPHLLSVFGRPSAVTDGNVLSHLEPLAVKSKDADDASKAWRAALEDAGFTKRLQDELGSDELRVILARRPKIGKAAEGFL
jgi:KAP family P-loop domain/Putative peptidoglycan binding domain